MNLLRSRLSTPWLRLQLEVKVLQIDAFERLVPSECVVKEAFVRQRLFHGYREPESMTKASYPHSPQGSVNARAPG